MSYANEYQQYGTNPYSNAPNLENGQGGTGYGSHLTEPPLQHEGTNYSQTSDYSNQYSNQVTPAPTAVRGGINQNDFLDRVRYTRSQMDTLSESISQISTLHQRALSSPDSSASAQLEGLVTQTQLQNTQIRDSIKFLEADVLKTQDGSRSLKDSQAKSLKRDFEKKLEDYQREELQYRQRYRDQIARQYKIVNPDATETEVKEASEANWGDEGVFQTALKSNRSGQATSVLGAVRARHNELQRIEQTLTELANMFNDMAQIVEAQEPGIQETERNAEETQNHVKDANIQIDKAKVSAARARKLKWWCLLVVVLIIIAIALGVGLGVGIAKNASK